jgi:hypothetical protein
MKEHSLRVFENRVLGGIFGPTKDEVTGEWRKLHNVELNDLYNTSNTVWVIKSRIIRWAGHVARLGEGRCVYWVLVENLREIYHWGDPDVDGSIILRWIFRKCAVGFWTGLSWLRIEIGGGRL